MTSYKKNTYALSVAAALLFLWGISVSPGVNVAEAQEASDDFMVRGVSVEESLERLMSENSRLRSENNELEEKLGEAEVRLEAYVGRTRSLNRAMEALSDEKELLEEELKEKEESMESQRISFDEEKEKLEEEIRHLQEELESDKYVLKWEAAEEKLRETRRTVELLSTGRAEMRARLGKLHYNLGVLLFQQKQYERAVVEFEKALETRPEDPDIHYNLAVLEDYYLHNPQKAIEHYRLYLEKAVDAERELEIKARIAHNDLKTRISPTRH